MTDLNAPKAPPVAAPKKSKKKLLVGMVIAAVVAVVIITIVAVLTKKPKKCTLENCANGTCTDGKCVCNSGFSGTPCTATNTGGGNTGGGDTGGGGNTGGGTTPPAAPPAAPAPASEKTVQKVRIVSNGQTGSNTIINLDYFQIWTSQSQTAGGGTATQSSTYQDNDQCEPPGCTADFALDSSLAKYSHTNADASTWWQLVLPAPVEAYKIQIRTREWFDAFGQTNPVALDRIAGKKLELYHAAADTTPFKTFVLERKINNDILL